LQLQLWLLLLPQLLLAGRFKIMTTSQPIFAHSLSRVGMGSLANPQASGHPRRKPYLE